MRPPIDPKKSIVLTRKGRHHNTLYTTGFIECITCGGPSMTRKELAKALGVSPGALSNFLNRAPVRADVADSIRAAVARVVE